MPKKSSKNLLSFLDARSRTMNFNKTWKLVECPTEDAYAAKCAELFDGFEDRDLLTYDEYRDLRIRSHPDRWLRNEALAPYAKCHAFSQSCFTELGAAWDRKQLTGPETDVYGTDDESEYDSEESDDVVISDDDE